MEIKALSHPGSVSRPAEPRLALALFASAGLAALAVPAFAQPAQPPAPAAAAAQPEAQAEDPQDETELDEVVVTASRQPLGAVPGNIPPEISYGPREIRGLGVSSVAELLDALAPQLASSRGRGGERPVTLVNGARISSFAEIRDLPPEAILRVDILPEEVALQYGYRADQRVINFVLRPRFRAVTTEVGVRSPTQGGRGSMDGDLNVLRIRQQNRLQIDIKAAKSDQLLESERSLIQSTAGRPYSLGGNVTGATFGGEIDPALSALTGTTTTAVGVPAGLTGAPGLGAFAGSPTTTTDVAPFRTLLPATDQASINAILTRSLGEGTSATFNARLEKTDSESRLGLPTSTLVIPAANPFSPFSQDVELNRYLGGGPLLRRSDTLNGHLGVAVNGARSGWRWSFTGNADRTESRSLTDTGYSLALLQAQVSAGDPTLNPFAAPPPALVNGRVPDEARSNVTSADAQLTVNGSPTELPAGAVNLAVTVAGETTHVDSWSYRNGLTNSADLSRNTGRVQASLDVPITSRRNDFLAAVGDLSVNFNAEADQLSDFGTLTTLGAGLNWSPIEKLRLLTSFTREEGAPSISQLGDPLVATPAVRVFDFVRGETVDVTQLSGGNPGLNSDERRVWKLGLNFKPFAEQNLTFRADWTKSRVENAIASFPTATAEIEAAFPERFVRNAEGRLVQIDVRPVNFARQEKEDLRWGFNYTKSLGPQRPPGGFQRPGGGQGGGQGQGARGGQPQPANAAAGQQPGAPAPQGAPQGAPPQAANPQAPNPQAPNRQGAGPQGAGSGGGGFGGGRGFGGRGGFRGAGSIQFAVFHTIHLQDEVLIRPGVPALDFLNGSAAGNGGGTPRHEVDVQAGYNKNGYGARLTAHWQSATEVRGGARGEDDLRFSDLTTVNARLFADLGLQPWARQHRWLRGARVNLQIDNIFDARQEVRTPAGVVPISYQSDYLDPLGRTVRLSFRKIFF